MTASLPNSAARADVVRVTVQAPKGRADLAIPASTAVSALLPVLLARTEQPPQEQGKPWVLQRLGEEPLDPDGTPESLELRHGDVLYLLPATEALPPLHFDDIADGVGHVVSHRPGQWRPDMTRWVALGLACATSLALAAVVWVAGAGAAASGIAGGAAAVLAGACVAGARVKADARACGVAGLGALLFAGVAGLAFRQGPHGGFAPGAPGVLVAAACVAVLACLLMATRSIPQLVPATALLTATATALGMGAMHLWHWHGGQTAAAVAVAMFAIGHLGPRLALRMSRLRVPLLPQNASELQQDIEPLAEASIERRVVRAGMWLDALALTSGAAFTIGLWYSSRHAGWIGWVLPAALSSAILLRARHLAAAWQRIPSLLAGWFGFVLVLTVHTREAGTGTRVLVAAVLLGAVCALLVAAWRMPTRRMLPMWGQVGDMLEMTTTIALLPLLLVVFNTYAYFRSLAG